MRKRNPLYYARILIVGVFLLIPFMLGVCFADEPTILEGDPAGLTGDNVYLGVYGSYYGDAEATLEFINQCRLEACKEGVPDPRNRSRNLTMEDYVEIRWSTSLEKVARIRASEVSFVIAHQRNNGKGIWTISYDGIGSGGEVLAWNNEKGMVSGFEQFYEEKEDWLKEVAGLPHGQTGHYTAMINPDNCYVGAASLVSQEGIYTNAVAGEFSGITSGLSEPPLSTELGMYQKMEVSSSMLGGYTVDCPKNLCVGDTGAVIPKRQFIRSGNTFVLRTFEALTYVSDNPEVVTVSEAGKLTAVSGGTATITVKKGTTTIGSAVISVSDKRDIKDATVVFLENRFQYDGTAKVPQIQLFLHNGLILSPDTQYSVSITNNVKVGKATITITGKGNCQGTVTKEFEIYCNHQGDFHRPDGKDYQEGFCTICQENVQLALPTNITVYWNSNPGGTNSYYSNPTGCGPIRVGGKVNIWLFDINGDARFQQVAVTCSDKSVIPGTLEMEKNDVISFTPSTRGEMTLTFSPVDNPSYKMSYTFYVLNETEDPEPTYIQQAFSLTEQAMQLTGEIFFQVAATVDESKLVGCKDIDPFFVFSVDGVERARVYLKDAQKREQGDYVLTIPISPKEINDKYKINFYANERVADLYYFNNICPSDYLTILASGNAGKDLADLAKALLNYCDSARMYFGYNDA